MNRIASVEQLAGFRENGYVVLRDFLDDAETETIKARLDQFISNTVPSLPREAVFYDDKNRPESLKQIQKIFDYDNLFHQLMFKSKFEQLAKELLRSEVVAVNMQYFNKPPKTSKPTPPHQDGYYFMLEPNEAVTMWLGLDAVDEENGCVRYIPHSNHLGLRDHSPTETLGFSQGIVDYDFKDITNEIALTTKPGDLLVHHALTIHRADANQSATRQRRAIGFIYYSVNAVESTAKTDREKALFKQLMDQGKI